MTEGHDWHRFSHLFKRQEVPAKTVLLREGEISKNAYAIEKGCLRFNNDGIDITTPFLFEGDGVSSIESFRTGLTSLFTIGSIEPTVIKRSPKKISNSFWTTRPPYAKEMEQHIFNRFVYAQKLMLSYMRDSPQQRYEEILINRPDIIARIPHIISLLIWALPRSIPAV